MSGCRIRFFAALTVIVIIVLLITAPKIALVLGLIAAILLFLKTGCSNNGSGSGISEAIVLLWQSPQQQEDNNSLKDNDSLKDKDPAAIDEAQALDVVNGGQEYRENGYPFEGFRSSDVNHLQRSGYCSAQDSKCNAADAEEITTVGGPPDPDWDRLAADAEAQGLSLSQGGGGPYGPAPSRGTPYPVPGYRPCGSTAAFDLGLTGSCPRNPVTGQFLLPQNQREGFAPLPGGHNPYPAVAAWQPSDNSYWGPNEAVPPAPYDRAKVQLAAPLNSSYAGAIEADERDIDTRGGWFHGHHDRQETSDNVIPDGNPFDLSRISAPQAAPPCLDDEANDGEMDIDEGNVNQVRSRNDPTRVEAGIFNRRRWLEPYLADELNEDYGGGENTGGAPGQSGEWDPWWGRSEI